MAFGPNVGTPPNPFAHLTPEEAEARLKRVQKDRANIEMIAEAIGFGLADEEELIAALSTRKGPVGDMVNRRGVLTDYPLDEDRVSRDLTTLRDSVVNRGVASVSGMEANAVKTILKSTWAGIVRAGTGVTSLASDVVLTPFELLTRGGMATVAKGSMGTGPLGAFAAWPGTDALGLTDTRDSELERSTRLSHIAQSRANVTSLLTGLPPDPVQQEIFFAAQPKSVLFGDIASMIVMMRAGAPLGRAGTVGTPAAIAARYQGETARRLAAIAEKSGVSKAGLATTLALTGAGALTGALTAAEGEEGLEAARYGLSTLAGSYLLASILTGRPYSIMGRSVLAAEQASKLGSMRQLGLALRESPRLTVGYMTGVAVQGGALGAMAAGADGKDPVSAIKAGLEESLMWIAGDLVMTRIGSVTRWGALLDTRIAKRAGDWAEQIGLAPTKAMGLATILRGIAPLASASLGAGAGAGAAGMLGADPIAGAQVGSAAAVLRSWGLRRLRSTLPSATYRDLIAKGLNGLTSEQAGEVTAAVTTAIVDDVALHDIANDAEAEVFRRAAGTNGATLNEFKIARQIQKLEAELARIVPFEALAIDGSMGNLGDEQLRAFLAVSGKLFTLRERHAQMLAERNEAFVRKGIFETPDGPRAAWVANVHQRALIEQQTRDAFADRFVERTVAANVRAMDDEIRGVEARRASGERALEEQSVAMDAAERAESRLDVADTLKARRGSVVLAARNDIESTLTPAEVWRELGRASGKRAETVRRELGGDLAHAMDELAARRAAAGNATTPLRSKVGVPEGSTREVQAAVDSFLAQRDTLDALARSTESDLTEDVAREAAKRLGGKLTTKDGEFSLTLPLIGEVRGRWLRDVIAQARSRMRDIVPALAPAPGFMALGDDEDGQPIAAWMPTAAAMASLAALGMVIHPWKAGIRFPMRIGSIVREAIELMKRSNFKAREAIVTLLDDGRAVVTRGERHTGNINARKLIPANSEQALVMLSFHNHPMTILPDHGMVLLNNYPSVDDLLALSHLRDRNFNGYTRGYILTPEGNISSFSFRAKHTSAPEVTHLLDENDVAVLAHRKGITSLDQPFTLDRVEAADYLLHEKFAGNAEAFLAAMDQVYLENGVVVRRNMRPEHVEAEFARNISGARVIAAQAEQVDDAYLPIVEKMTDPPQMSVVRAELARPIDITPSTPATQVDDVLARVAPAGAARVARMLPMSVTPQAVTQAPLTLDGARKWAAQHGLALAVDTIDGKRTFVVRLAGGSDALASDITLRGALSKLAVEARKANVGVTGSEAGNATIGAMLGSLLGAPTGVALQQWMRDPDSENYLDPNYGGVALGAALGTIAGALLGATAAGMKANRAGRKMIELFAPPPSRQMHIDDAVKRVGKTGVTKAEFLSMPIAQQIQHRGRRLVAAAQRDSYTIPPKRRKEIVESFPQGSPFNAIRDALRAEVASIRRSDMARVIRKYTPTHIPAEHWDKYVDDTLGNARMAGYDEVEAQALLRGSLVHMLTDYRIRINPSDINLLDLARQARNQIGRAGTTEELRRVVTTARVMSGPDMPVTDFVRNATHANLRNQITPDAEHWKEVQAIAAKKDFTLRGTDPVEAVNGGWLLSWLRPPEGFRTTGERLAREGNADGDAMLRLHSALMGATETIRTTVNASLEELSSIFHRVSRSDRMQIRKILEDPAYRAQVEVNNPALFRVAERYRTFLDGWAEKLGMDPGLKIEDYFPWIYSTRTMAELKRTGRIPTDIFIPIGSGIPEYKIWKHLRKRMGNTPLGEILEDPLEVGTLYAYGAIRKYNLDPIMTQFDGKWFRDLARNRPIDAADMGRWMLDVFGMPSQSYVRLAATLQGFGMKLEEFGAAFGLSNQGMMAEWFERFFTGHGAVDRFTRTARAFSFYTKLGGNFISPLVNLSQLVTNSGTDMGFASLFIGGGGFTASTMGAAALEMVEKALPEGRLSAFIHPYASGNAKLRFAREVGIYSDASRSMLENISERILRESGPSVSLTAGGIAVGAAAGVGAASPETELGQSIGFGGAAALGGVAGAAFALMGPVVLRRMLRAPLHLATAPFQMAEAINRGMTAGAARMEFNAGRKLMTGEMSRTSARMGDFLEGAAVGGVSGALVGGTFGSEMEDGSFDPDMAMLGAMAGAGLGAGTGLGRPRAEIAAERLRWIDKNAQYIPDFRHRLQEMGAPSLEDAERWYVRQALDMAQFRFGREARPQALRTPFGEVAGSLQSFTLNQMEFFGSRYDSFIRSVELGAAADGGLLKATATGKIDMRIWKHMILLGGAGAALTSMTASLLEDENDPWYWLSRVGMGFMPLLSYNTDAQKWQLNDIGDHLTGPFIKDVWQGAKTMWHMVDPVARMNYEMEVDTLARRLFTSLRQLEGAPEVLGKGLEKARQEGLADLVRGQAETAEQLSYPGTAIRQRAEAYGQ